MNIEAIQLLLEAKQALINRDAVKCYDSGEHPCNCTLCKIDRFVNDKNRIVTIIHDIPDAGYKFMPDSEQGIMVPILHPLKTNKI